MNLQLAESLANAVVALPTEDYALFQNALISNMIRKTPGLAGGSACIRNTRIAVWTLISLMNQGADDQELLRNFPGLNLRDLEVSRSYYANLKEEIDTEIESNHREDGWDD
jgi:uncharacterized protein (DUF433 family)